MWSGVVAKIKAVTKEQGLYYFANGYCMKRENETLTPGGNKMSGRWVLRDSYGELVDFDKYSNDIAER